MRIHRVMNGSLLPGGVAPDSALSAMELRVLALLGCFVDKNGCCCIAQTWMARSLGRSRNSVQIAIAKLIQRGWLEKHQHAECSTENATKRPFSEYIYRVNFERKNTLVAPPPYKRDDEYTEEHFSTAKLRSGGRL